MLMAVLEKNAYVAVVIAGSLIFSTSSPSSSSQQ
jgi:hypothetical protein